MHPPSPPPLGETLHFEANRIEKEAKKTILLLSVGAHLQATEMLISAKQTSRISSKPADVSRISLSDDKPSRSKTKFNSKNIHQSQTHTFLSFISMKAT